MLPVRWHIHRSYLACTLILRLRYLPQPATLLTGLPAARHLTLAAVTWLPGLSTCATDCSAAWLLRWPDAVHTGGPTCRDCAGGLVWFLNTTAHALDMTPDTYPWLFAVLFTAPHTPRFGPLDAAHSTHSALVGGPPLPLPDTPVLAKPGLTTVLTVTAGQHTDGTY